MNEKFALILGLSLACAACGGSPSPSPEYPKNAEGVPENHGDPIGTGADPITHAPPGAPPSGDAMPTQPGATPAAPSGPASGTGTQ